MAFKPQGQELPKPPSDYFKFEDGDNKIRILADSISGYKYQALDGKYICTRKEPKITTKDYKLDKFGIGIKFFLLMPVWSYRDKEVKILELTQVSIMRAIDALDTDVEWGDVKGFDIKIIKEQVAGKTKYSVQPSPNKTPISKEFLDALSEKDFDFNKRFEDFDEEELIETPKEEVKVSDLPF